MRLHIFKASLYAIKRNIMVFYVIITLIKMREFSNIKFAYIFINKYTVYMCENFLAHN